MYNCMLQLKLEIILLYCWWINRLGKNTRAKHKNDTLESRCWWQNHAYNICTKLGYSTFTFQHEFICYTRNHQKCNPLISNCYHQIQLQSSKNVLKHLSLFRGKWLPHPPREMLRRTNVFSISVKCYNTEWWGGEKGKGLVVFQLSSILNILIHTKNTRLIWLEMPKVFQGLFSRIVDTTILCWIALMVAMWFNRLIYFKRPVSFSLMDLWNDLLSNDITLSSWMSRIIEYTQRQVIVSMHDIEYAIWNILAY